MERIVIEDVRPRTPNGYPAKAVVQRPMRVTAVIFRDGHEVLSARARWRPKGDRKWSSSPLVHVGNDRWHGGVEPASLGAHELVIEAWTDEFATWRRDIALKHEAGQDVDVELEEGARLLAGLAPRVPREDRALVRSTIERVRDSSLRVESRVAAGLDPGVAAAVADLPEAGDISRSTAFPVWVDRERASVGAWYELFPRSNGGLRGAAGRLPAVADMGFDVVYLPPVHPIGRTARKGRDNTLDAGPDDVGSPWAIGSADGGHTAIEPALGTLDDFGAFMDEAEQLGLEVALDYALQCSPDHPWVHEHPEWFHHRPDGSIKYAENPPKKYQDIYPLNLWPAEEKDRQALWEACKELLDVWIARGVRIFRVDNPHTKPFALWEWMIPLIQASHPEVVFLSEAFTRPALMARLAEVGFSQSYTYFTWRTHKGELQDYVGELAYGPLADYMRPNFWPNTPDILSGPLRHGHAGVFMQRLVLAATLSPSYGIYSGYELCENEPASEFNEEYRRSEKYEIKERDWSSPRSLAPFVRRVNQIRRSHPAFSELSNVRFEHSGNDQILAFSKVSHDGGDVVLVVVNLDPFAAHEDTLWLDLARLGLPDAAPYEAHDELSGETFVWSGPSPYVRLAPEHPAHILHLRP
ncbi:MAG: alpha-1,4-glucan--maltose-1-phosphate maltosyltransferase [Acidimicrobiia bacterium]|nr:alpha-1,4-glucan--maltose-1-phosphate maltosyltransferase [Acidimicrobiia bacterium]